jgi:hypothetical protein
MLCMTSVCLDLQVGRFVLIVRVEFRIIPGNPGGLDIDFLLEGRQFRLDVRQVEPDHLSLAAVLESKQIGALQGESLVDVRESEVGFIIWHSEDVGTLGVVLILRHVVVYQSHLFLRHPGNGLDL